MSTRQSFSKEFKESIVKKILHRDGVSIEEICDREGVGRSTAVNWLRARAKVPGMKKDSRKWSAEEKLEALIETRKMVEPELGVYLRQAGLHSHRLNEWRSEALKSLDEALAKPQRHQRDERDVKIAGLERELLRKDKALAEASALLILQKKVHLIWEKSEEVGR